MTTPSRPPYRFAFLTTAIVLTGYLVTLAPTVTFWDAGEFIAASKSLGIPHPPGTPLFVLIAHVWGVIFPFFEYAVRTNILSALFSAMGAGLFFLVVYQALAGLFDGAGGAGRIGGAMAAAVIGAFTFTNWQNSNETEVYAVATFMIAAICWLCLLWRRRRGSGTAPRALLLVIYLAGLAIGNHLLTLLAGGGVAFFLWATLRHEPAADRRIRRREWAEASVVVGLWLLLIGVGLGSTMLSAIGGACFLLAAGFAVSAGAGRFALLSLLIGSVGVTTYGYPYIRSDQKPAINEAQPDNLKALISVIRREQYPPRTPLDDPTVASGPGNPGRTFALVGVQFLGYLEYFDWQWANGVRGTVPTPIGPFPWRTLFTLLFLSLGLQGIFLHWTSDRPSWWLLMGLFLVTGFGLVIYMNFKPGFSLGLQQWPNPSDHEVRERDYFFVVSFVVWGLWAGIGLAAAARAVLARWRAGLATALGVAAVSLLPFALNFDAAGRRHGPDARLAADLAYDLLNSVPPYSVLFTYGDNDTFPLWWAQEVEGIRQDVTVVCLALASTDWYIRQLRDYPIRPFDEAHAPAIWQGRHPVRPAWPLHTLTDDQVRQIIEVPTVFDRARGVPVGPVQYVLPANQYIYPNVIVVARILQENFGRRPIAWSITTGRDFKGIDPLIVQQGLAYQLSPGMPDTTSPRIDTRRLYGTLLDVVTTDSLLWHTYRYSGLLSVRSIEKLDPTTRGMAWNLGIPYAELAFAYQARGERDRAIANLERAATLISDPGVRSALSSMKLEPLTGPADSGQ